MATSTIEIEQDGGYDKTIEDAKRIFKERYPERGEPTDAKFLYAYPARMGEKRTVGMEITH